MPDNKIHLIGNAHLDPVWLWRWQEGLAEVKATFKSALDRMDRFDDFKFTSACSAYYMWIEKSDPAMFERIKQRVREGRWCIVGGWFIQPDCNIPSGESFARHALISQRYFMEKFGLMAQTGYNVDSFGHNQSIPKMLRQSRMKNYVFMRPAPHEKELPAHLFLWQSNDGSSVNAYRIPFYYNITGTHLPFSLFYDIADIDEGSDQMAFYGVGNHGGGPTEELLTEMHEKLSERFVYSTPDEFFACQSGRDLPVVCDDLQYHAKGCYSALSEIKKNNRYAESKLIFSEKASVLSKILVNTEYPSSELKYAWERVLFNQFHDIMCGCCIRPAVDDARLLHGEAMAIADRISNFALQQISWSVDTSFGENVEHYVSKETAARLGKPVVVFNMLERKISVPVEVGSFGVGLYESVIDEEGTELPVQKVRAAKTDGKDKYATIFNAELPAFGYRVYRILSKCENTVKDSPFSIDGSCMSNSVISIRFRADGEIESIIDRRSGREILSAPTRIRVLNDEKYDTWAHGIEKFDEEIKTEVKGSFKFTEFGPVRATARIEQSFGESRIVRDVSIYPESDRIDVRVKVDFREKHRILKLTVPVDIEEPKAFCKIPFGYIQRDTDGTESVCGDWISLCDGDKGITVVNDSKHSFDANGNELSLTVLRSTIFADHYGERDEFCEFSEQGEHFFNYAITLFGGFEYAEQCAKELQNPPTVVFETYHKGELPRQYCGIAVSEDNVSVTAIKQRENGNGTVIRLYETCGRDTSFRLTLFGKEYLLYIPHGAIKTYCIDEKGIEEIDFIE